MRRAGPHAVQNRRAGFLSCEMGLLSGYVLARSVRRRFFSATQWHARVVLSNPSFAIRDSESRSRQKTGPYIQVEYPLDLVFFSAASAHLALDRVHYERADVLLGHVEVLHDLVHVSAVHERDCRQDVPREDTDEEIALGHVVKLKAVGPLPPGDDMVVHLEVAGDEVDEKLCVAALDELDVEDLIEGELLPDTTVDRLVAKLLSASVDHDPSPRVADEIYFLRDLECGGVADDFDVFRNGFLHHRGWIHHNTVPSPSDPTDKLFLGLNFFVPAISCGNQR